MSFDLRSWFEDGRINFKHQQRVQRILSSFNQSTNQQTTSTNNNNSSSSSSSISISRIDSQISSIETVDEFDDSRDKVLNSLLLDVDDELSEFELTIIRTRADEIVRRIESKRLNWNAKSVIRAFIKSATRAQLITNCLTEVMFEEALERADELDKYFELTGKLKGRLHGLPVSLKDQIDIRGIDSTIGFTKFINKPAEIDSSIYQRLIDEGAIPFTKTNVPQTMFSFECSNPIFGTTDNPYMRGFTAGGSSGGEAALLASDGTCLGVGSDVGGSLRIPAHYCGCYSLKPCAGRIAQTGLTSPTPGFKDILATVGPMTRCWEDLVLFTRVLLDRSSDPTLDKTLGLIPITNFRDEIFDDVMSRMKRNINGSIGFKEQDNEKRNAVFGACGDDSVNQLSKPCERAVLETVEALKSSGYDCVEIDVNRLDILEGAIIFVGLSSGDGYQSLLSNLGNDIMELSLFLTTIGPNLPSFLRWTIKFLIKNLVKDEVMSKLIEISRKKSIYEIYQLRARKDAYCQKVRSYLWEELRLDGLICPTQAVPAVPNGSTWNKSFLAISTFIWNVVDSSVGQIPITRVDSTRDCFQESLDGYQSSIMNRRSTEGGLNDKVGIVKLKSKLIDTAVESLVTQLDRMEGLPVGVQLVCGIWEEEKVLGLMGVIEDSLNQRDRFIEQEEGESRSRLRKIPGDYLCKRLIKKI
ncbi:amidase signature domain-containing protein [Phakopsora pachyrhizi]|uniref:amidase n=1 Tax=Phakopsora pachyrhizi TaxID=170000 RepID=A0AAV0BN43_PHAPC|nr:amidase signature domain-containing protein [Phakopsora pachyrhizi]